MKKYSTIIFDLDDTLIDNTKASNYAFKRVLEKLDIPYRDDLFYSFLQFDAEYWYKWENGLMIIPSYLDKDIEEKRTYLRASRFTEFFNIKDFNYAVLLNNIYCNNLGVDIESIDGAREILEYLKTKYRLVIATNGPFNAASNKLSKVDFNTFFESIYCSELLGYSKPDPKFWNAVFDDLKEDRSNVILIGDSLTTDVVSGIKNGFDTIWYNPEKKKTKEIQPTYEINHLLELKRRL